MGVLWSMVGRLDVGMGGEGAGKVGAWWRKQQVPRLRKIIGIANDLAALGMTVLMERGKCGQGRVAMEPLGPAKIAPPVG